MNETIKLSFRKQSHGGFLLNGKWEKLREILRKKQAMLLKQGSVAIICCEFCELFQSKLFIEQLRATAPVSMKYQSQNFKMQQLRCRRSF